jgi:DNA transformation protein
VTSDFRDFVVLQLGNLRGLTCKAMFGGYGLWANGVFFGIIYEDKVYFRTGPDSLSEYIDAEMQPFATADFVSTNYYEVPPEVMSSGIKLVKWAETAVGESLRIKKSPKRKPHR